MGLRRTVVSREHRIGLYGEQPVKGPSPAKLGNRSIGLEIAVRDRQPILQTACANIERRGAIQR